MNWKVKIRTSSAGPEGSAPASGDRRRTVRTADSHRHPAMSGLDISPVHGRHCICHRCEHYVHRDAA